VRQIKPVELAFRRTITTLAYLLTSHGLTKSHCWAAILQIHCWL